MTKPLPPEALYQRCDTGQFSFKTTAELADFDEFIGQGRAVDAIRFGIGIQHAGYNLFALGPSGVGKHTIVSRFLELQAAREPTPEEWCYVNNFAEPEKPRALRLPAGQGVVLRRDMERLVDELRSALPAAFESEDYRTRKQGIEEEIKERHQKAFEEVRREAGEKGVGVMRAPTGVVFAPLHNGEVYSPDEFEKLPETERQRMEADMSALQQRLQSMMREAPQWERQGRERLKALNHEVAIFAVGHLLDELRRKYETLPEVVGHLQALQQDVVDNIDEFLNPSESPLAALVGAPQRRAGKGSPFFRRYQVNLMVDHGGKQGAPVVYEDFPSYQNLLGQVEHTAQFGALVTDFDLIRPGALHRANGGFLVVDAQKVLMQPYAWEGLKRALRSGEIRIESLGQMLSLVSTVSLEPQPIPLRVKVVLLGERLLYYLLAQYDTEFREMFKVAADFEEVTPRNPETHLLFARLMGTIARQDGLLPFDAGAVGRLIELRARLAGDAERLSTHRRSLVDLLRETDYWARQAGRAVATADDVQQAVDTQIHRLDRVRERLQEEIQRGTLLIDTEAEKVGQINGLAVSQVGQFAFGHPTRITARVRLGKGEVVDIEREVELGGPIHSKGVLILSAFLGARYAPDRPLSLSASLVFEQSYGGVEGDSASCAELYVLLSALAEAPLSQSLAVTGSVNQHGHVQAIGGVNEKIEGFFDLCKARGLTGQQGVLIPDSNVKHLMLRQDVVEAVAAGRFHVYAVATIDQGIEILTGLPAGERDSEGRFPEGTLNQRVESRLMALAEKRQALAAAPKAPGEA
ncbi:MAG TPA: AAA family ATPase [Terriglobia bacterium]|nr:AAA family ATPase [Terriglobia bacterium]